MCDVLAQAFADDPVWRWLVPDDRLWERGASKVFAVSVRPKVAAETVWVTGDPGAAAVWGAPGAKSSTIRELLALPRLASVVRGKSLAGLRYEGAMKQARPEEPHWYLAILGTRPQDQGKGLGSSVLQPVLDRCNAEGIGAYLESSKEENIPFYRRHGFDVVEELRPVSQGPALWSMWRDP